MKKAICYSGSFRTFADCIKNHKEVFGDCDVYISTWSDPQRVSKINDIKHSISNIEVPNKITEKYVESLIPDGFNLKNLRIENYDRKLLKNIKTSGEGVIERLSYQYYKIKDCHEMVEDSYDLLVRMRCDIKIKQMPVEEGKITFPRMVWHGLKYAAARKMMNEMVWACDKQLMDKAVKIYDNLDKINSMLSSSSMYGERVCWHSFNLENLTEFMSPRDFDYEVIR